MNHIWLTVRRFALTARHLLQGQDQCRIIKSRLQELVPGLHTFLDVDDLKDIAEIRLAVHSSFSMLVFMSRGYFRSRGCSAHPNATHTLSRIAALLLPYCCRSTVCQLPAALPL